LFGIADTAQNRQDG